MALTREQQSAIIEALESKIGERRVVCPVSGDSSWQVQNKLANIPASGDLLASNFGDAAFPTAVLVCNTCGYTILLNLFTLGLAEEFGLTPELAAHV